MSLTPLLMTCLMLQAGWAEGKSAPSCGNTSVSTSPPLLIYFSSRKCTTCASIDSLFQTTEMLSRIEQRYVTVRVSVEDQIGKACAEIYDVRQVPAIVVADYTGAILYKSIQPLSVQDIFQLIDQVPSPEPEVNMHSIVTSDISTPSIPSDPSTDPKIVRMSYDVNASKDPSPESGEEHIARNQNETGSGEESKPEKPDVKTSQQATEQKTIDIQSNIAGSSVAIEKSMTIAPENDMSTSTSVAKTRTGAGTSRATRIPHTYSIQLGYFTVEPNADKLLAKAQSKGLTNVFTQIEKHNGLTYFRVLAGKYASLSEAQVLLTQIHSLGLKGAVYRK